MSENIGSLMVTFGADTSGFMKGLSNVKSGLGGVASDAANVGNVLKGVFGIGVAGALTAAVKGASDFDKSLKNIQSVTGRTSGEMAGLSAELLKIGADSGVGPQAVADTFYDIVGGVSDASTHMAILQAALATSKAGAADLGSTTKGLISIMNAYGLSADQASYVSDVLTKTVGVGVGSMDEFVSAIGPLVGIMASVGEPVDRVGAAMAFMTTKGVSASQAATQLKAATTSLLNPNAEMIKLFKKAGIASGSAAIKQYGLAGVLGRLQVAAGGSADAMAKALGSVEALSAATLINSADFEDALGNFEDGYKGATAAAAAIQGTSFASIFDKFRSSVSGAAIAVGNLLLPPLGILIQVATAVVQYVAQMNPVILAFAAAAAVAVVAAGPLAAAIGLIASPVGLLVIAVGGIAVAFNENFGGIRDIVVGAYNAVKPELDNIGKILTDFWQTIFPSEKSVPKFDPTKQYGTGFVKKGQGGEPGDFQQHTMNPGQTQQQPEFITRVLRAVSDAAPKLVAAISDFISAGVQWLVTNGPTLISNAVSGLFNLYKVVQDKALGFANSVAEFIGKGVRWLIDNAPAIVQNAIGALFSFGQTIANKAPAFLLDVASFVFKVYNWLIDTGKSLVSKAIGGLLGVDPKIIEEKITAFLKPVQDALSDPKGFLQNAITEGKKVIQQIIDKFEDIKTGISKAFQGVVELITAPFREALRFIGNLLVQASKAGGPFAGLADLGNSLIAAAGGTPSGDSSGNGGGGGGTSFRALGGPVGAGNPYVVGERGPELFVPGRNGTIIPNNRFFGGGGNNGGSNTLVLNQPVFYGVQDVVGLFDELEAEAGRRNIAWRMKR